MRRRNAAKKKKLNAGEKSKSTDTEDESAYGDEGRFSKLIVNQTQTHLSFIIEL